MGKFQHEGRIFTFLRSTSDVSAKCLQYVLAKGEADTDASRFSFSRKVGLKYVWQIVFVDTCCGGVLEETISDILWHAREGMTAYYSAAQVEEIYQAVELIKSDANQINVSLLSLVSGSGFYQNSTGGIHALSAWAA